MYIGQVFPLRCGRFLKRLTQKLEVNFWQFEEYKVLRRMYLPVKKLVLVLSLTELAT